MGVDREDGLSPQRGYLQVLVERLDGVRGDDLPGLFLQGQGLLHKASQCYPFYEKVKSKYYV